MKNFIRGMDETGHGFTYLRNIFLRMSDAKIKKGISVGPQNKELLQDEKSNEELNEVEKTAWLLFKNLQRFWKESQIGKLK